MKGEGVFITISAHPQERGKLLRMGFFVRRIFDLKVEGK